MNRLFADIFIDFDDTLYDTHGNADLALSELFEHFGLKDFFTSETDFKTPYWQVNTELWALYAHGKISRDELIIERFRRPLALGTNNNGMHIDTSDTFCLEVSDYFLEQCSNKSNTVDGAHEALAHLKQRGYRLHLCSNGFCEVQYKKLNASHLDKYFDTIILSEEAGANKPSAQFFDFALQKSGAQRQSTLMIGDNFDTDIVGAINAKLSTMFFNRQPSTFKAPQPTDYEIHSLHKIIEIL